MNTPEAQTRNTKHVLTFTLPLAVFVGIASLGGLLRPEVYSNETTDWATQSTAQDIVDLFLIIPLLIASGLFVYKGESLGEPIWGGSLLYTLYTFIIYCFAVHFNSLFLVYVGSLGLSVWGFVYFIRGQLRSQTVQAISSLTATRIIGFYFIAIAATFSALWLGEIVPAIISGEPPATLVAAGLSTNPVQVLDLSVFLPGIFLTGVLMLRRNSIGFLLAPVLLVFFVLMDITIAVIFFAQQAGDVAPNIPGVLIMSGLALVSLGLLVWLLKDSNR